LRIKPQRQQMIVQQIMQDVDVDADADADADGGWAADA
jgi:hypothetical protein